MTENPHQAIPVKNAYQMTPPPEELPDVPASVTLPSTTLYIRPLWRMADPGFREIWEELISDKPSKGRHPLPEKRVFSDRSVLFATGGLSRSVNKARNLLQFLRNHERADLSPFVPVLVIVDAGVWFPPDGAESRESDINWSDLEPGEIFFSHAAYNRCREKAALTFEAHPSGKFYRLADKKRDRRPGGASFLFGAAIVQGTHPPCFYCGLGRHASMNCPSKLLDGRHTALESLGYLSLSGLNALFFGYLMGARGEYAKTHSAHAAVSHDTAVEGAMELLYIHQLRFFARLWGTEAESWDKIGGGRSGKTRRKGGWAWLAFDCLRSSNHPQAAEILDKALESTPHDFWLHCIRGYLHIEQNAPGPAADAFGRALGYAVTAPQRIFIHFLIFRILMMDDRLLDAEKHLDEIFSIDTRCLDAVYQSAVFCLRRGEEGRALEKILGLIHGDRRYFVRAQIAPELSPFHRVIGRKLGLLYDQARDAAEAGVRTAQTELERMKAILGEDDRVVVEMTSLWIKAEALFASESYFGYLDACHSVSAVGARVQREIRKRQEYIYQLLAELDERCLALFDTVKTLSSDNGTRPLHAELKWIRGAIDAVRKDVRHEQAGALQKAMAACREISEKIGKAGAKLEILANLQIVRNFLLTFSRINLIFQPINLLIGIVFLPLIVRYFLSGSTGGEVPIDQIRLCQVGAVFLGGATGIIYAIVKCLDRPAPGRTEP
ncbi:tetratricopeptide repeat protein [Desulfococcus sp.]|uniref:tetratricopeptide repeat protein n=1 Tax=Desulfococcus sp. TaxID=2025834 RepID=UPI003593E828